MVNSLQPVDKQNTDIAECKGICSYKIRLLVLLYKRTRRNVRLIHSRWNSVGVVSSQVFYDNLCWYQWYGRLVASTLGLSMSLVL